MNSMELQMLVHPIQSDRIREAQDNRLVRKVLRKSQKQSTFRADTLTLLAHRLTSWVQGVVPEPAG